MDGPHPYIKVSIVAMIAVGVLFLAAGAPHPPWVEWALGIWWAVTFCAFTVDKFVRP